MVWLASLSLLITADSDGVSGRQFVPILPALEDVRLEQTGYGAMTHGGRACLSSDLHAFQRQLKIPLKRTVSEKIWVLKTPLSWLITRKKSLRLATVLRVKPHWLEAIQEQWSATNTPPLKCFVLSNSSSAQDHALNQQLDQWEIRWRAEGQLGTTGPITEISRPIGDGSRRFYALDQLRRQDPMNLWVSLGNLLEGWSWVRDGPSLHRETTVNGLAQKGPEYLLLGPNDSVVAPSQLKAELSRLRTSALNTFGKDNPIEQQGAIIVRGNQRVALLAITSIGKQIPHKEHSKRIDKVLKHLSQKGPIHRVIMLARSAQDAAPYLDDSRIQLIAIPGSLNLKPRTGSFALPEYKHALHHRQSPVLIRIPTNAITELKLGAMHASVEVHTIDERVPASPALARQVNAVRHNLYPTLSKPLVPALDKTKYDAERTTDLVAGVILRAAQADALVLPKMNPFLVLPGGLSRLDLLGRLVIPSPLVSLTADGGTIATVLKSQVFAWRSREKLSSGRPVKVITTAQIADQLKSRIGNQNREWVTLSNGRLVSHKSDRKTLPRVLLPLLERQLKSDPRTRVLSLMRMPATRTRTVLRIDKLQLSAFSQELRAPVAHRTLEDPRTNQPSRTSIGGHLDLRLIQPIKDLEVSVRGVAAYTRDLFPEDNGVAALDKESLDDWSLTLEAIHAKGKVRPFTNVVWDSEWTAGDPNSEVETPRQTRLELNTGLAIPKTKRLHEARLAATGSQDLTRILTPPNPTSTTALPGWRFAVSGLMDWRRKVAGIEARLLIDARYYLPENEPLPNTLLWAVGERLELAIPVAGNLRSAIVIAHTIWQTHDSADSSAFGDHQFSLGFSLDFKRVMRPLAGLF